MPERVCLPLLCAGLLLLAGCGGAPAATSAPVSSPPAETVQAAPSPSPSVTPMPEPTPEPTETTALAETPLPTETPAEEADWTPLDTGSSFGRSSGTGGSLAVYAVQAGEDGLTVTLAPLPNEADVNAFQEAEGEEVLPAGTVDYWSDAGGIVLQLENVVLSSGEIGGDDWLHDFFREQGMEYPFSTPMGAVPGDCPLFEKAAISSDGSNTTISLLPDSAVTEYQVTALGVDGLTVSFRLALR